MLGLHRINQLYRSRRNTVTIQNAIRFCMTKQPKSYYEILGLSPDCSSDDIRKSFSRLSKLNHPDTSEGKGNSEQFQNILEAYRVLSKDETRANYDAHNMRQHWRSQMNSGGNNFNYSDLAQKLTASEHSSMRHQEETARRDPDKFVLKGAYYLMCMLAVVAATGYVYVVMKVIKDPSLQHHGKLSQEEYDSISHHPLDKNTAPDYKQYFSEVVTYINDVKNDNAQDDADDK